MVGLALYKLPSVQGSETAVAVKLIAGPCVGENVILTKSEPEDDERITDAKREEAPATEKKETYAEVAIRGREAKRVGFGSDNEELTFRK